MIKYDLENSWFVSDLHFSHDWVNNKGAKRGVLYFERTQFQDSEEHDKYIIKSLEKWAEKHKNATLFILGDFGRIDYLYIIDNLKYNYNIHTVFVYGNHDKLEDYDKFAAHFDEVYLYPTYIAPKILISHEPQFPAPENVINVHGHLHTAYLDSGHHLCASIHMIDYHPLGWKSLQKKFAAIDKYEFKFLREPYARCMVYPKNRPDVVVDKKTRLINYDETLDKYNKTNNKEIAAIPHKTLEY